LTTRVVRALPILVAASVALIELATYGGLYFPDTTQFVRHGFYAGYVHRPFHSVIPPAYPLLLDGVMLLFAAPHRMFGLVVIQQASAVAVTYFVLRIGEVCDRPRLGWIAAFVTALYVPLGLFAQSAQTETLSVFLVAASCLLLSIGMQQPWEGGVAGLSPLFASGAVAGIAVAQRTVNVALPLAAFVAIWTIARPGSFKASAAYGIGIVAVLGLFVGKNVYQYGHATLVEGTGIHLYGRVAMIEQSAPDTRDVRLLREVAQKDGLDGIFFPNAGWALAIALSRHARMDDSQADRFLRSVALSAFADDLPRTVWLTYTSMKSMVQPVNTGAAHFWGGLRPETYARFEEVAESSWRQFPREYQQQRDRFPGYPPPAALGTRVFDVFDTWAAFLQRVIKGTWNIWAMLAVGVVGLIWRKWQLVFFAGLPLLLLAMAAFGDQPFARYWEVAVPWFVLGVLLGGEAILSSMRRWMRRPEWYRAVEYTT